MPQAHTHAQIRQYYVEHPNATFQDVMRDLGITASTLSKFRRESGMARSGGAKLARLYLTAPSTLSPWERDLVADVEANITLSSRLIAMRHPHPDGSYTGRKTIDNIRQVLQSNVLQPPPKNLGVWRDIDWSRSNSQIAKETGRHLTSVARVRMALAPPNLRSRPLRVSSVSPKPTKAPRTAKAKTSHTPKEMQPDPRQTAPKTTLKTRATTQSRQTTTTRPRSSQAGRVATSEKAPTLAPRALSAPGVDPGSPAADSVITRAPASPEPVCPPSAPVAGANDSDSIHPSDDMGWADPDGTRGAFVTAADQWMDVRRREGGSAAANGLFQTAYAAYTRLPPQAPPRTPPHSSSRRKGKGTPVLCVNSHPPLADHKAGDEGDSDTDLDLDLDLDVDHADIAT